MHRLLLILALVTGFAIPSFAAENPWVGTWKLDISKSNFTGDTFSYSKLPSGMMHYSNGADFSFDFANDGKPYKVIADRTISRTEAGKDAWDEIVYGNGKELARSHETLSSDGKTLTTVSTGTRPDGTTYNNTAVYTRVSGSSGLEGKWRNTKVTISSPDVQIATAPADGTMKWETPSYHSSFEGKTDGSDIPYTGPTVPPGMVVTMKATAPGVLSFSSKLDGKVIGYDIQTLAPDGKSYTDVSWSPGKESEKTTGVYVKQ